MFLRVGSFLLTTACFIILNVDTFIAPANIPLTENNGHNVTTEFTSDSFTTKLIKLMSLMVSIFAFLIEIN